MSISSKVFVNTGILYFRMALTFIISLYSTRVTLNALGVEDFGIFNLIVGVVAMLTFLNVSMTSATQRFMSYANGEGGPNKCRRVFSIALYLHFIVAVLIVFILEAFGYLFFDSILNINTERAGAAWGLYQICILSTFFIVLTVPYDAVLNSHENMLVFAVVGLLESFVKLLAGLLIANYSGDRLFLYGILISAGSILITIFRAVYCFRKYLECRFVWSDLKSKEIKNSLLNFAYWSFWGSTSSLVAQYSQGLVLNINFGPAVNAAQGIANQVSGQLSSLSLTMLRALNPQIDKSEGAGNRELMLRTAMLGSKIGFFLFVSISMPFFIEMSFILKKWLVIVPDYVFIFCVFLLMRNMVDQLFSTLHSMIAAVGNMKKYQIYATILHVSPLVVSILLFKFGSPPHFLYMSFLIYSIALGVLMLYYANKECGLNVGGYVSNVILRGGGVAFLSGIFGYFVTVVIDPSWMRVMLVFVLSFVALIVSIRYVGLDDDEIKSLLSSVSSIWARVKEKFKNHFKYD